MSPDDIPASKSPEYRKLALYFRLSLLTLVVCIGALFLLDRYKLLFGNPPGLPFKLLYSGMCLPVVPAILLIIILKIRGYFFRCPKCHERWLQWGKWGNGFRRCSHCGLPLWEWQMREDHDKQELEARNKKRREDLEKLP